MTLDVAWSASGGTVTSTGLYTAPDLIGGYRVIASQSGGILADTADVIVNSFGTPATVNDLVVSSVTATSMTLRFTGVDDGTGQPANYFVRFAQAPLSWSSASDVVTGTCAVPLEGVTIGGMRTCTVLGLAPATSYQFQLVAFRGTLNVDAVFGALSQVASGATSASTAPVATVTVTPASASTPVGQTVQFSVVLRDALDNILAGRVVTWVSSNTAVGTVSATGLVTGLLQGTALITATSEGRSDTATITVTSAPSAGVVLFHEHFEDQAFAARGWYDNTNLVTTTAQHVAGSTRALEERFLPGATTPISGGAARHLFTPTPTLYVSFWVKYSSNWVGSNRPYHPHEFLVMSDQDDDYSGLANGWLVAYIEHSYHDGGIPRLALQDNRAINTSYGTPPINLIGITENRSTSGCNGVMESDVVFSCFNMPPWYNDKGFSAADVTFQPNPGAGYKGEWNHVEVYFQLNSVTGGVGRADGIMQYWFNGSLVIDRRDVVFRTGARATIQFRQFAIAPYIGDGSPVDQTMWVDDLTVATARP